MTDNNVFIDGRPVAIENDRNLLELIRRSGIDMPTFCYHSDLSVYGACRLCVVDIEGMGIQASCSVPPRAGMKVKTHTAELRESRKLTIELLLANHDRECPSCSRSSNCSLQNLATQLGVEEVRFEQLTAENKDPLDTSSPSLVRDTNKCILCGDCVRVCDEVQKIGALDFTGRGADAKVGVAFDKGLGSSECVACGQCAAVCPTGAITPKQERSQVWDLLHDDDTYTVAIVAPAVRVGLGDAFGLPAGEVVTGKIANALRMLGFDQVYDACFSADMTILEEAEELLRRIGGEAPLPMFTSCCPAWVRSVETGHTELKKHLSSCKSPQQMFGAVIKKTMPDMPMVGGKKVRVVSIMPCTAKKMEARLPQHRQDGQPDIDQVLTTQELTRMIHSLGIRFADLEDQPWDLPMGFASGAGVLFGASGGVMEAALRYVSEAVAGEPQPVVDLKAVRGQQGIKTAEVALGDNTVNVAVAHGLGNAKKLLEKMDEGEIKADFIEVMACPGGCIAGAGQPISMDTNIRENRTKGIYRAEKQMALQKSQDNHLLKKTYDDHLGDIGGHTAHGLLHTKYQDRSAMLREGATVAAAQGDNTLPVTVHINGDRAAAAQHLAELEALKDQHPEGARLGIDVQVAPHDCGGCGSCAQVGLNGEVPLDMAAEVIRQNLDA